jgi:hypothetical protein
MLDTKKCSKCSETKLLSEYYSHPRTKDRKQPVCKVCMKFRRKKEKRLNEKQRRVTDYLTGEGFDPLPIAHLLGINTASVRQYLLGD